MKKQKVFKHIFTITVLYTMFFTGCSKTDSSKNPYEYNINHYKTINPDLILYEKKQTITLNTEPIISLKRYQNYFICLSSKKQILFITAQGKITHSFPTLKQATAFTAFNEKIYLAFKDTISVYDFKGNILLNWPSLSEQAHITSLDVNNNLIAIADAGNKQIWLFNHNKKLIKIIHSHNQTNTFILPGTSFKAKFFDHESIILNHAGKLQMEKYSLQGNLLLSFGSPGMELDQFAGCCNPVDFLILPDKSIITFEKGLLRIKLFNKNGVFQGALINPLTFQKGTEKILMSYDSENNIYLYNSLNKNIIILTKKNG